MAHSLQFAPVASMVGFVGELRFDTSKPNGTPQKLLDVSRLFALGWCLQISLPEGLWQTYAWYLEHKSALA